MDEWQTMFGQVQTITREARPLKQSLERVIAFARNNPALFDEPDFWGRAQGHDFRAAFATLTSWAKQGLEALALHAGWQFLLLDLGDCPEPFRLYSPGGQGRMSKERFRDILLGRLIVGP